MTMSYEEEKVLEILRNKYPYGGAIANLFQTSFVVKAEGDEQIIARGDSKKDALSKLYQMIADNEACAKLSYTVTEIHYIP